MEIIKQKIQKHKRYIKDAEKAISEAQPHVITDRVQAAKNRTLIFVTDLEEIQKEVKRTEKINDKYGHFFDKVISDGMNAEEAARELKLL